MSDNRNKQFKSKKQKGINPKIIGLICCVLTIGILCYALNIEEEKEEETIECKETYFELKEKVYVEDMDSDNVVIDWEQLKDCNVVGWIKIGNDVDYPIVQGEDNNYYLRHLYDGSYNANGSIFMSCYNNPNFTDSNTIVYGHNMHSGVMFGSLKDYLDANYDSNKEFYIYLPDGTKHTYKMFCVSKVKSDNDVYKYAFATNKGYLEFQEYLKSISEYDLGIEPDVSKKMVTLSTCRSGSAYGNRFVIVGMETKVEQMQKPASWYKNICKNENN